MITVIGDVHGKSPNHLDLIDHHDYTVQIGDLGFCYDYLAPVDPLKHKFFMGNHDNYDIDTNSIPHDLGEYGLRQLNHVDFFFVRGAFSVDWPARVDREQRGFGKSWWPDEQLSVDQGKACLEGYADLKPDVVLSHSLPDFLAKKIGKPGVLEWLGYDPETFTTITQQLLQDMFKAHEPDIWLHGHMHISHKTKVGKTVFIGLNELETYEL